MRPISASYLARRLLNTEVNWTHAHRDEPGFALIDVTARLEDILPQLLPASAPARSLIQTLKRLKISEQIDRTLLELGAALLPPLIEQAKGEAERLHAAANPDHPMVKLMQKQTGPLYFQVSDPLFQYHAASDRQQALKTLASGLAEINQSLERKPPAASRG